MRARQWVSAIRRQLQHFHLILFLDPLAVVLISAASTIGQSDSFDETEFFEGASAKIRCAEAATAGAAIAHQVFGAIGFTKEHILHRFTLRILAWRDDFGSESYWAAELGRHVAQEGADEFWPMVASR